MFQQHFDLLRERLLRAGIAPRHVRRYLGELSDHLDDLVREETAKGLNHDAAIAAARTRLGGDDTLAEALITRPGLRSFAARFPLVVFVLGAGGVVLLVFELALLAESGFLQGHLEFVRWLTGVQHPPAPVWVKLSTSVWNWLMMYAVPLLVAVLMIAIGMRQRTDRRWIVAGIVIVSILGGMFDVGISWSDVATKLSELSVTLASAPVTRSAINLVFAGGAYFLWLRRGVPVTAAGR